MAQSLVFAALAAMFATTAARGVPANVQTLYNNIVSKGTCSNKLASGFYSVDDGRPDWSYCGDHISEGIIYIQGKSGQLADTDIDCDGAQDGAKTDKRCEGSTDTQSQTSFKDTIQSYDVGITDLDAFYHPYVVFGNEGTKPGWKTFDPEEHGVEPLSVMAVVCNGKMFFGIWGDENGDDGDHPMIGETSISMATLCFGESMTGDNGHDVADVLYIAFTGSEAVPGADGAAWDSKDPVVFEESISSLGSTLLARIGGEGGQDGGDDGKDDGEDDDGEDDDKGNGDNGHEGESKEESKSMAVRLTFSCLQALVVAISTTALMI